MTWGALKNRESLKKEPLSPGPGRGKNSEESNIQEEKDKVSAISYLNTRCV